MLKRSYHQFLLKLTQERNILETSMREDNIFLDYSIGIAFSHYAGLLLDLENLENVEYGSFFSIES